MYIYNIQNLILIIVISILHYILIIGINCYLLLQYYLENHLKLELFEFGFIFIIYVYLYY